MSKKLLMNNVKAETIYTYNITYNQSNVLLTNRVETIKSNETYTTSIIVLDNYELSSVVITVGEVDVTDTVYNSADNTITINKPTGDISITVVATKVPTPSTLERYIAQAYYNEGLTIDGVNRAEMIYGWQNRVACSAMTSKEIKYIAYYLKNKGYDFTKAGGSKYGYWNDTLQLYVYESVEVIQFEDLVVSTILPEEQTIAKACKATGVTINSVGNTSVISNSMRWFKLDSSDNNTLVNYLYNNLGWKYETQYIYMDGLPYLADKVQVEHINKLINS